MSGALRDALHIDREQLALTAAGRGALGVVTSLVVGALTGHIGAGLTAAIGAENVAFADRPGPYRLRLGRTLLTALAAAMGAFLGILIGRVDVLAVLVTLGWAFGAGMLVALGPTARQVGVTSTVLLLVLAGRTHFMTTSGPATAALVGLEVLAGGVFQALLAISAWPLRRYRPERLALAKVYSELADAAALVPGTDTGPALTATIDSVQRTLRGFGRDRSAAVDAFRVLLDEAERLRIELLALTAHAERLQVLGANAARGRVVDVLEAAARMLRTVGDALASADPPQQVTLVARRLNGSIESLHSLAERSESGRFTEHITLRAAAARAVALGGQLRAAAGTVSTWRYEAGAPSSSSAVTLPESLRTDSPLETLRANLVPTSAAFRHALRLACCVALCDAVVRSIDLSRGYWLPLTVLIILQPDFSTTSNRGMARIGGTLIGLGLATGLVVGLPDTTWTLLALVAVLFFTFRALILASYGVAVVFLSALVVVMLSFAGAAPSATILERAIYTLIGGLVAVGVYLLWPTWERSRVRPQLADLLTAYEDYLALVTEPEVDPARRASARAAARVARSNAEASLDRLRGDLGRARGGGLIDLADGVLANSNQFVHASMRWEAARQDASTAPASPALQAFSAMATDALDALAIAVRASTTPRDVPDLRAGADAVQAELFGADSPDIPEPTRAALAESTDRIADSLNTLAFVLRSDAERRPRSPEAARASAQDA